MGLEGELRIGLRVTDGHIECIHVSSTRPDVAHAVLQGRTRALIGAAVPRLFSICGHSQAVASELACAAAAAETVTPDALARGRAEVSAEMVRECAWRILLDWPQWIGEAPSADAVAAARASLGFRSDAPAGNGTRAIALAAFGCATDEWLAQASMRELDRWIDAGQTATARFIRRVRDDEAAAGQTQGRVATATRLLDVEHDAAWIVELSTAAQADPEFARQPAWRGAPAETGALARQQADPLIAALVQRSASRVPARFVARLRELALLLTGQSPAAAGAAALPSGSGVGWVENARGLLVHQVRLDDDRAATYRIIAPTEWNFHPAGALSSDLAGAPAADPEAAKSRTTRVVHSLDPCVACHVEFEHA